MLEKIFSLISSPVLAQAAGGPPPQIGNLADIADRVIGFIFPIGVLIAVVMIIYGGYMWIISGGDPARKQVAQGTLTWAVLGLVFLFLIRAILLIVVGVIVIT